MRWPLTRASPLGETSSPISKSYSAKPPASWHHCAAGAGHGVGPLRTFIVALSASASGGSRTNTLAKIAKQASMTAIMNTRMVPSLRSDPPPSLSLRAFERSRCNRAVTCCRRLWLRTAGLGVVPAIPNGRHPQRVGLSLKGAICSYKELAQCCGSKAVSMIGTCWRSATALVGLLHQPAA
jgi:hypothetical protein